MRKAVVVCSVVLAAVIATAAYPSFASAPAATAGYEKLKSLAGEWQTKTPEGEAVTITYRLISGGHALQEENSHGNMVTIYHLDGDSVLLTHYCMANNQPRMRASGLSADGKTLDFKFVDAANLAKPADMHMHALKVTFQDADHITQEWLHSMGGKETPAVFPLTRKK